MTQTESSDNPGATRVAVVEDHALTRHSLVYGLNKNTTMKVVAEYGNGEGLLFDLAQDEAALAEGHPQIVLMDLVMPVVNGIDTTRRLKAKYPQIKVIVLTSHSDAQMVLRAFQSGADSYCLKNIKLPRLLDVIRMTMEGTMWIDPAIAGIITQFMTTIPESKIEAVEATLTSGEGEAIKSLSTRETEILTLISTGLSNKQIADKLCLSLFTVKNHVSNIIHKLSVADRTQAAILALQHGLSSET